jgi:putative ABC transport system permease protein
MLLQMAWANLFFNRKRTALMVLLVAAALCSIILYRGYVAYSREGMKLGFIEKGGNIQIAAGDFWKYGGENQLLNGEVLANLQKLLANAPEVKSVEPVLDFSGIIGTMSVSRIFWGKAYENPHRFFGITGGNPVFPGDDSLVLGSRLAETLGFFENSRFINEGGYVNIMTSLESSGLSLGSFAIAGITDTGVPQNDEGLVIASRKSILDFLGLDDIATYIQVYLLDDKNTPDMETYIAGEARKLGLNIETRNWIQLNPSFSQINTLNEIQCAIFSGILCFLIVISITQSLSAAFNERLSEFGTLEAIGLGKQKITVLLALEVLLLSALGLGFGILFSWFAEKAVAALNIMLTFPGYSASYPLRFYLQPKDIAGSALFVLAACFLAMASPVYHIRRNTVIRLIYRIP